MWYPTLKGIIERRLLINYRLDPEVAIKCLPKPFLPQIVNGYAMAGVCLIRMSKLCAKILPFPVMGTSENGALRFAVKWEHAGKTRHGVYIPARYTTSRLAAWAGMRFFPGRHYHAQFQVREEDNRYQVVFQSPHLFMNVSAQVAVSFPGSKVFASLGDASEFFQNGTQGYSEAAMEGKFDGVELRIRDWKG